MKEDFLQYLWKYKKFKLTSLKTTQNEELILQKVGIQNIGQSGPDFFDARLIIDHQKWAGNVEVHLKSSDWFVHHHENDPQYDNVILHVVWQDDISVFRRDDTPIPTLQLSDYVDHSLLERYNSMFRENKKQWISCEQELSLVPNFVLMQWKERLYVERLEEKSKLISSLLSSSANDWETVLFMMLAKNFGLKVNREAFLNLACSIKFTVIRKTRHDLEKLEALFFGQAGFLEINNEQNYKRELYKEYAFLKNKFKLDNKMITPFRFFRLRPANFPTIRLAQLAKLYHTHDGLFSKIIKCTDLAQYYELFNIDTSRFWDTHYTFTKSSAFRKKYITKSFIDLILINTIIPIKFLYQKNTLKNQETEIFDLISVLDHEENNVIKGFMQRGLEVSNAFHSQALIQLKTNYCEKKACLQCAVGNYLLNR